MPRKHQAIIQSGGNKGKLKKGYRYSGKKLKNGLPQIVKVKKSKKTKKTGGNNHDVFTLKTHNIGARNHFFNYYNNIQSSWFDPNRQAHAIPEDIRISYNEFSQRGLVPPKIFVSNHMDRIMPTKIFRSFKNRCQTKLGLSRNILEYMQRTEIANVYLLQEVQPMNNQQNQGYLQTNMPNNINITLNYEYRYNQTGHEHFVASNNEHSRPEKITHGCAVVWNSDTFSASFYRPVTQGSLAGRSTGWVILTKNNQNFGFLSIHGFIDEDRAEGINRELNSEISSLVRDYPNIIPIIGGDFNQDIRNVNWDNGIDYLNSANANGNYLDGQGTNDNHSFKDDIQPISPNSNRDRSIYSVRPTHFTSSVDFFLSNDQLDFDNLQKIQRVRAGVINPYDLNYDLISDFDHYPLMMNVTIPESRKKKKVWNPSITVADSPKASKKVSKKSTLNPNANAWNYTDQIV